MTTEASEDASGHAPKSPILLSIIVPVYNEQDSTAPLAAEIERAFASVSFAWEVVWVDDGSSDDTCQALRALGAPHRYLRFAKNCGQSAALKAGFEAAKGEWVGTLDGDGQNDPQDIVRQLEHGQREDVDMVNGVRVNRNDSFLRRWSSKIANSYRRQLLKDTVTDVGCSTRVVRRTFVQQLPFFNGMHRYLPALVAMRGGRITEIPVNHRPRQTGQSKYGVHNRLWVGLRDVQGVRWLVARQRPWQVIESTDESDAETGGG